MQQGCRSIASRPPKWSLDTGGAGLQTRISGETKTHRRFWRFEDDESLGLVALTRVGCRRGLRLVTSLGLVRLAGLKTRAPSIRR